MARGRKMFCHDCGQWVHLRADGCAHIHLRVRGELATDVARSRDLVCPGSDQPPRNQPERRPEYPRGPQ